MHFSWKSRQGKSLILPNRMPLNWNLCLFSFWLLDMILFLFPSLSRFFSCSEQEITRVQGKETLKSRAAWPAVDEKSMSKWMNARNWVELTKMTFKLSLARALARKRLVLCYRPLAVHFGGILWNLRWMYAIEINLKLRNKRNHQREPTFARRFYLFIFYSVEH